MTSAVQAVRADHPAIAATLASAFLDDPVQRWAVRQARDPEAAITAFMGFFVGPYFRCGHTYVVAGTDPAVAGAALWAPPDRHGLVGDDIEPLVACLAAHVGDSAAVETLAELGRAQDHLPSVPHFYLGILAVDPAAQNRGIGARLLEPGLRQADEGGFVSHLESSNPRNLAFYRRHGFDAVDEYHVGDDGPLLTVMSRPPR